MTHKFIEKSLLNYFRTADIAVISIQDWLGALSFMLTPSANIRRLMTIFRQSPPKGAL